MASGKRVTTVKTVERVVQDIVREDVVELRLSMQEAKALRIILNRIGGDVTKFHDKPESVATTVHDHANSVLGALYDAGVVIGDAGQYLQTGNVYPGSLYFNKTPVP